MTTLIRHLTYTGQYAGASLCGLSRAEVFKRDEISPYIYSSDAVIRGACVDCAHVVALADDEDRTDSKPMTEEEKAAIVAEYVSAEIEDGFTKETAILRVADKLRVSVGAVEYAFARTSIAFQAFRDTNR